jgi:uncharacterized RDD family membrane protein YckC
VREYFLVTDLPTYPEDAAEREAALSAGIPDHAYASWLSRVGAYLLDVLILVVPLIVFFAIVIAADPGDTSAAWIGLILAYIASIVLPFVYFTVLHGNERGQTYGKRVAGIRVVDERTGRSIGYGRAFGRYGMIVIFGLFLLPLLLDYLWPLWDSKHQAWHDKVVSSVVVQV